MIHLSNPPDSRQGDDLATQGDGCDAVEIESLVQVEMGPASGETTNKDVRIGQDRIVPCLMLIMYSYLFLSQYTDVPNVKSVTVEKLVKVDRVIKLCDTGLVGMVTKLLPHGVEHHLSQGSQAGVFLNLSRVQANPLSGFVIVEMLTFHFIITDLAWPTAGLFLDFLPHVDVISEETVSGFWEVPYFLHVR